MRRNSILLIAGLLLLAACLPAALPQPSARTAVPTWTLPFPASTLTFSPATSVPRRTGAAPKITPTPPPTTPSPSPSPTARPGIDPTLGVSSPDPYTTSYIPIPDPVSQRHLDPAIVNILLVGRDTAMDSKSYRTDVMIVVSINKKTNSATLLTIPRDLYVYIPGYKVERINTAAEHGDLTGYPGGGMALLEQTILYNLGIPIHGWAAVDFSGFKQVVDLLGGVDVPVSCSMSDWRLKDPSLDQQNANNWEMFTVPAGVQHMDGDYALWYARARKHSSDFERSHRQHQVLRAMLDKALQLNMLTKIPQLYATYGKIVETDLGLGDILQFVPLATQIGNASIKSRFIGRTEVFSWTAPDGAMVLLPDRDGISRLLDEAFLPPAVNMLARTAPSVEIWNGTTNADWAALAADNLAWDGLQPVIGKADAQTYAATTLYDYTTSPKGSPRQELERLFHLTDARVVAAPDPNAGHPFRVILGSDFNSCVTPVFALRPTPTPPGGAAPPAANITHAAAIVGQPPPIDGDLKEWTSLPYPINEPIFGQANWHGPSDLSGAWNAAWDDLFLYLAVRVKDDVFVQTATGENLYKGDSLEVWLDIDPGSRTQALTGHDFQLGISPGNLAQPPAKAEMYLWRPTEQARSVTDGHIGALLASDGYTLEVAVPWSAFHVTPFAGEGFAFTLALNDDDTPGTQEQQKQAASLKGAKLTDPTTWGILVLDSPPGP